MIEQLPSLEEIYDLSSKDLQNILQNINASLPNSLHSPQRQQKIVILIENIQNELQQRKTIQFFQQICTTSHPYLEHITNFNNQFLKLASEAIAAQQYHQKQQQSLVLTSVKEEDENTTNQLDSMSVTSALSHSIANNSKFGYLSSDKCDKNALSTSQGEVRTQKRMGIGKTKSRNKNTMKQFILKTLTKNKPEGCFILKKGGNLPPKPQPSFTVNERGHLVNTNTLQPISKKAFKPILARNNEDVEMTSSNREIKQQTNSRQLQERRKQAFEKVKGGRSQKRNQKPLNNKDLVEMIKQEEKQKVSNKEKQRIEKQNKSIRQQEPLSKAQIQAENYGQAKKSHEESIQNSISEAEDRFQCKKEFIQSQESQKQKQDSSQKPLWIQEQGKQINVDLLQQTKLTQAKKHQGKTIRNAQEKNHNRQSFLSEQYQGRVQDTSSNHQEQTTSTIPLIKRKDLTLNSQINRKQDNLLSEQIKFTPIEETKLQQHYQQLAIIQQQLLVEIVNEKQKKQSQQKQQARQQQNQPFFGQITQVQSSNIKQEPVPQTNIIYNQQYWIRIREQAQAKIQRFKQQKEVNDLAKKHLEIQEERVPKLVTTIEQSQIQQEQVCVNPQQCQVKEAEVQQSDFVKQKRKQFQRILSKEQKRKSKPIQTVVAPMKPLYPRPEFNYLEVYPSFNHIFSVMYTKAEHQAIAEIPGIMRDLVAMFSTHLDHFKALQNHFKPAVFLPFDSGSGTSYMDPRQLLLHAQNTHVNLKTLVERLEIFNGNLHGQFSQLDCRYYRVVKTKQEVYDIITSGFLRRKGWKQLPHGCSLRSTWNLFWSWSKPDIDVARLLVWQRINHFPFNKNLSRKDLLYRNLDSFRKMLKISFPFLPLTFNLPKEFTQFSMKFHQEQIVNRDRNYWIMKPIGKSRGRGIKVINNLAEINYTENIVVQQYISNPLLLDGYKFDMRIYVLVTSFHPLEAFLYKQGFARLSTEKFSLEPSSMKNQFVHLTNFAINRNNQQAKQNQNFAGGSKISLKALKQKLAKMNYSFGHIWGQVQQIIIKSLLGCSVTVPAFPTAFQLFGYDIMVDSESNCHLIQINASPSLERTYMLDQIVKQSLIDDILDIVDPPDFDKTHLLDIMSERLLGRKKFSQQDDLVAIGRVLKYKAIRRFGEVPEKIGLFDMIAPSKMSLDLERLIKSRSGANNPMNID